MKAARIILLILALVALGAFGFGMWRGSTAISSAKSRVGEQLALIKGYEADKMDLIAEGTRVGNEMAALPDSIRSLQTGKVMGAAQGIAKREAYLDGLIFRAQTRIATSQGNQAAAQRDMMVWGAATGLPFLILLILFARTGRRPRFG